MENREWTPIGAKEGNQGRKGRFLDRMNRMNRMKADGPGWEIPIL
jgi:hypothetical protein